MLAAVAWIICVLMIAGVFLSFRVPVWRARRRMHRVPGPGCRRPADGEPLDVQELRDLRLIAMRYKRTADDPMKGVRIGNKGGKR